MIICWNFQNCSFSQSHFFFILAKKIYCLSKRFQNYNVFLSGIVFLTRCCLQFSPRPHSFPVCLCWNFENSKILLFIYNFCYNFFLNITSQMYINVRCFLLNTIFWSSIAVLRKNDFLFKTWVYSRGIWLYHIYFILFHKRRCESSFFAYIWLDLPKIHLKCLSFT